MGKMCCVPAPMYCVASTPAMLAGLTLMGKVHVDGLPGAAQDFV